MNSAFRFVVRNGILLLGGLLLLPGFAAEARADGRAETLQAIRAVENPRGTLRPGRHGELGPYQFRSGTWRMHTRKDFSRAIDPRLAEEVAVRHYEWLSRGLRRHGLPVTPYNIALAWNGGLTATIRGRAPAAAHDYATRVSNLAHEFDAARIASTR